MQDQPEYNPAKRTNPQTRTPTRMQMTLSGDLLIPATVVS